MSDFCDKHCTWLDHHPDCDKAEQQPVALEPAPDNSLPKWDECAMRCENSKFFAKSVEEGGHGPDHDSKLASALHRFIYEYDDADTYRSSWFLHRLEQVVNECKSPQPPRAEATLAQQGILARKWILHGGFADVANFDAEGFPSFYWKESAAKFKAGELSTPCKGKNCGSLNGWLHSAECRAEHEAHYAVTEGNT
jgi:hypothetical protein